MSIMNAIAPVLGGIFGAIGQRKGQERQFKFDKALADHQFRQQQQMWNQANAYNSPQAQMQRFKDAGLNPNMIYGQGAGAASGQTSTSLPQYSQSRTKMDYHLMQTIPTMISQYQDIKLRQAQIDQAQEAIQAQEINNASKAIDLDAKRNIAVGEFTKWQRNKMAITASQRIRNIEQATQAGLKSDYMSELSRYHYDLAKNRAAQEMAKTLKFQRQADWLKFAPSGSPIQRFLFGLLNQSGLPDALINGVRQQIRKRK